MRIEQPGEVDDGIFRVADVGLDGKILELSLDVQDLQIRSALITLSEQ